MSGDNSDNQPIELEVQAPQALHTQTIPYRRKWGEENKQRVMDLLSFKDKDIEDIAFSAVVYISGSMFCSSLIFDGLAGSTINPVTASFIVIFAIAIALAGIIAWWLIEVVPESRVLVLGRLVLVIIGVALGASR
jgi:hypothetical protein